MWNKKDRKESEGQDFENVPVKPDVQRYTGPDRREVVKIGKSILIKGEVSGGQNLIIDGGLEGKVQLKDNQVTVGENGKISGEIHAKSIIIHGQVVGNMFAEERLEIKTSGSLKGDITSPRVVIDEGAYFKGSVHMEEETHRRLERPVTETEILKVVESEE
ncbi:MAG TPA: polymer-forming cytoskeletal protein [Thermodesulfobacteriota bacterium]|nr:polymer-forming cytoskeletal protein [Thermodesulfobacteriota bacterium]